MMLQSQTPSQVKFKLGKEVVRRIGRVKREKDWAAGELPEPYLPPSSSFAIPVLFAMVWADKEKEIWVIRENME